MDHAEEFELRMMANDGAWIVRGQYTDSEEAAKDMRSEQRLQPGTYKVVRIIETTIATSVR